MRRAFSNRFFPASAVGRSALALSAAACAALLGACSSVPSGASAASGGNVGLQKVAAFEHQVTGVAVTPDGRIFVSFPRWTEDNEISVAELQGGALIPFPDASWNAWRNAAKDQISPKNHWVCVQSIVTGPNGNVWVLDPAAPAMAAVVKDGPKLVEIDMRTRLPARVVAFGEDVAPQGSYLNDVRFSPDGGTAYLTDSGAKGALIVVDLTSGKARRVLDGDPRTQPDPTVTVMVDGKPLRRPDGRGVEFAADGIALSVDGSTLYWQAIKGKTLYSVPTAALRDPGANVAAQVRVVGENGPADGLVISRADGRMYITSPQDDAVKVRELRAGAFGPPTLLVQDARLRWPDTFAEGPDGSLYLTTSRIQDSAFFKPGAPAALPTELWRMKPPAAKP